MRTIYLADVGDPDSPAATAELRERGLRVIRWVEVLSHDVVAGWEDVEAIVVLPGWPRSKRARLEIAIARSLDKPVLAYPDLEPVNERPLEQASNLVHADRGRVYGHPADDFARTAGMWQALFGWAVRPEDVPLAMVCVKLSRLRQTPDHEDSPVDIAGYAEAYWMVIERLAKDVLKVT